MSKGNGRHGIFETHVLDRWPRKELRTRCLRERDQDMGQNGTVDTTTSLMFLWKRRKGQRKKKIPDY